LAYALLDTVVDTYFLILEKLDEKLEDLDARIENRNNPELMERLREVKFDLISLRRAVWPLREVTDRLQKQDIPMFGEGMPPYLRDLYDHVLRVIDTVEVLRETLASLTDTFHAAMSNDMNAVMKVLTIIATIFIPLTFIAGIYGMNFTHMPELSVPWAYPALLTFMAVLAGGMLIYFRWKRWL
jgi:magnesium transporter